jgi:predicted dehydrogenase
VLFEAPHRVELYGSAGWAVADGTLGPLGRGTVTTSRGALRFTPVDPYLGEILDFVAAVRQDRRPEVDGREGLRNVALLLQMSEGAGD